MDIVIDELKNIFIGMGFEIDDGPEVEESIYNFDRLNSDENHPAREWTDTFYLDEESRTLLRTQTSNMEPRIMETRTLPIRAAVFGRCYRQGQRWTPPTARCSTRWRAWSSTSTSPSPT